MLAAAVVASGTEHRVQVKLADGGGRHGSEACGSKECGAASNSRAAVTTK